MNLKKMNRSIRYLTLLITLCALLFNSSGCEQFESDDNAANQTIREPVIFIHGGTIDDFTSYLLLTTMEHIDLQAVILTNTDTLSSHAMQVQWKIMDTIEDSGRLIGLSSARGWNPFPWLYRSDAIRHYNINAFQNIEDNPEWPPHPSGDTHLFELLSDAKNSDTPVTLLITCPLTPLSDLLQEYPHLESGIERVIWMGGAIQVDGNLDSNTIPTEVANPKAEWNAYWDPYAVDWIFKNTSFPILLFPLDVTDQAPITKAFMDNLILQASNYRYSDLVYQSYALVGDEPYFEMWNTLTTTFLAHPEFFDKPETMHLKIEVEGYSQGAISQTKKGRQVEVVFNIAQKEAFYEYVLEQLRRNYVHDGSKNGLQQ